MLCIIVSCSSQMGYQHHGRITRVALGRSNPKLSFCGIVIIFDLCCVSKPTRGFRFNTWFVCVFEFCFIGWLCLAFFVGSLLVCLFVFCFCWFDILDTWHWKRCPHDLAKRHLLKKRSEPTAPIRHSTSTHWGQFQTYPFFDKHCNNVCGASNHGVGTPGYSISRTRMLCI